VQIESITVSNFRSFGPDPLRVTVSTEITAIVGPNGAGKTAFLHALIKLYTLGVMQRHLDIERERRGLS
jgi:putative ATP-dependent endonuclease of OLD family